jgi:predicted anti-sigma-YlaC factor YlaD
MNTCKKIKDLILTDYLDKEADQSVVGQVNEHLLSCADCRLFAQDVKEQLALPFESTIQQQAPEHLWTIIKDKIQNDPNSRSKLKRFIQAFFDVFSFPYLAPALAGLIIVILLGSVGFYYQLAEKRQDKEQGEYLVSLWRSSDVIADIQSNADQTSIEKYFL